jgi:hypothetical protein
MIASENVFSILRWRNPSGRDHASDQESRTSTLTRAVALHDVRWLCLRWLHGLPAATASRAWRSLIANPIKGRDRLRAVFLFGVAFECEVGRLDRKHPNHEDGA